MQAVSAGRARRYQVKRPTPNLVWGNTDKASRQRDRFNLGHYDGARGSNSAACSH